ncbi:MAG: D-cysteine desulfhydrase family protein [Eubacteriales bacterium]|nr:D-cysteine desulfhydrase family protein [Eubacteriales bacterium]
MLLGHEKICFINTPTPLEPLPTLSRELGVELWIKRDDLTNLGGGGNKLRKLEYLLAEAQAQGATTLLTVGGAQTNHGRLTAAVAAKYGMKCVIVCVDDDPGEVSGNLLLDRIMGAEVVLQKSDGRPEEEQFAALTAQVKARYEARGERVYEIPMGGSNVTGMLGYYECAMELTAQAKPLGLQDATVCCAVGSMGTYMGLYCGLKNEGSPLELVGIAISPFGEAKERRIVEYFGEAKAGLGLGIDAARGDFRIEKDYTRGAYNNPSEPVRRAIYHMGHAEGILLDPCYTGKAFAGLCDMIRQGRVRQGSKLIFLHTGGMPELYTPHHRVEMERELRPGVTVM